MHLFKKYNSITKIYTVIYTKCHEKFVLICSHNLDTKELHKVYSL